MLATLNIHFLDLKKVIVYGTSCASHLTDFIVEGFYCADVKSPAAASHGNTITVSFILTLFRLKQRHSGKVISGFPPELGSYSISSSFLIIIRGSHDWDVEEGVTEEALYKVVDPEVEVAESQLETEEQ